MTQPTRLRRSDLYSGGAIVDGQRADRAVLRWQRRAAALLVSKGEREEAQLEDELLQQPTVSRANVAAVISPKGGVGKTTSAFVIGNLLTDRMRLRTVAVDANPDFGTLAALAPDPLRSERSLADLLADIDRIATAAQLRGYITPLPSGLHLLGSPDDAAVMADLSPDDYGTLLALLATFYELVILDLGTGVAGELARFAIGRADQVVLVTTPEWVTSTTVLAALDHVAHDRTVVAVNKFHARGPADVRELERRLRERRLHQSVAIPHDDTLATMLDTATYQLEQLDRTTRMPIKRLGLAVAQQLV